MRGWSRGLHGQQPPGPPPARTPELGSHARPACGWAPCETPQAKLDHPHALSAGHPHLRTAAWSRSLRLLVTGDGLPQGVPSHVIRLQGSGDWQLL